MNSEHCTPGASTIIFVLQMGKWNRGDETTLNMGMISQIDMRILISNVNRQQEFLLKNKLYKKNSGMER